MFWLVVVMSVKGGMEGENGVIGRGEGGKGEGVVARGDGGLGTRGRGWTRGSYIGGCC